MKTRLFFAVLALQSAFLLGMVGMQETRLASGQTILLEVQPVDPRDLLRGDYVILSYRASRLDKSLFTPTLPTLPETGGNAIYVVLEPKGKFHEAIAASLHQPGLRPNQVLLKGRSTRSSGSQVWVDYGLERYYVPEGKGNPRGKLTVEAAVAADGQAVIKQVFLNDRPYLEAMRNQP